MRINFEKTFGHGNSDTTTPASASTTSALPTYSPAPISNGTYYIGAQSFAVVIDFKSASGNLHPIIFMGDISQQVFTPRSMDVDIIIA
jgi:hypothetical protein